MENLRAWLNGCRNYASGAALYNQYGTDAALKRMFAEPESPFKHKRLCTALEAIWEGGAAPAPKVPAPSPVVAKSLFTAETTVVKADVPHKQMNGWPVLMDETLTALHTQWKGLFLDMVDLQSRLYEVAKAGIKDKAKEREAGTMALRILALRDAVNAVYQKRDYYLQHGSLPEPPAPVEECLDPTLWPVKLQNAKRYVRDYKQKWQKHPGNENFLQQLNKWTGEVEKYERLLKRDDAV